MMISKGLLVEWKVGIKKNLFHYPWVCENGFVIKLKTNKTVLYWCWCRWRWRCCHFSTNMERIPISKHPSLNCSEHVEHQLTLCGYYNNKYLLICMLLSDQMKLKIPSLIKVDLGGWGAGRRTGWGHGCMHALYQAANWYSICSPRVRWCLHHP